MIKTLLCQLSVAVVLCAGAAHAASNVDPQNLGQRYGWTENGGWLNMRGDDTAGVYADVRFLHGFAWHENFGWINFGSGMPLHSDSYSNASATDFGVNVEPDGGLSGYAWGENIGWIAFNTTAASGERVRILPGSGRFTGYAWGENVGWLNFETVDSAYVATVPGHTAARDWSLFH